MSSATLTRLADRLHAASRPLHAELGKLASEFSDLADEMTLAAMAARLQLQRVQAEAERLKKEADAYRDVLRQSRQMAEEAVADTAALARAAAEALAHGTPAEEVADPCEPRPAGAPAADPSGDPLGNDKGAFGPAWEDTTPRHVDEATADGTADADEVSAAACAPNKQQDAAERLLGVPAASVTGRILAGESSGSIAAGLPAEDGVPLTPAPNGRPAGKKRRGSGGQS